MGSPIGGIGREPSTISAHSEFMEYFIWEMCNLGKMSGSNLFKFPQQNLGFDNAHPWLFKFPQKMKFEKSEILGQAWAGLGPSWAGLGPAQKRQKWQP